MGWEKGKYYTRSRKVNGRVVREYVGCGPAGDIAAILDAARREHLAFERGLWLSEKEEMDALDAEIAETCRKAELVARATMVAAGFYKHNRQWRRRRVTIDHEGVVRNDQ